MISMRFEDWYKQFPGAARFVALNQFNMEAVLDKETGLVWEQSPSSVQSNWFDAIATCQNRAVGGRKGWSLPFAEQLASLVDPNNPSGNPDLPPGHPFSNVLTAFSYWTATTRAGAATDAKAVVFVVGAVGFSDKGVNKLAWCARGGQVYDGTP